MRTGAGGSPNVESPLDHASRTTKPAHSASQLLPGAVQFGPPVPNLVDLLKVDKVRVLQHSA